MFVVLFACLFCFAYVCCVIFVGVVVDFVLVCLLVWWFVFMFWFAFDFGCIARYCAFIWLMCSFAVCFGFGWFGGLCC